MWEGRIPISVFVALDLFHDLRGEDLIELGGECVQDCDDAVDLCEGVEGEGCVRRSTADAERRIGRKRISQHKIQPSFSPPHPTPYTRPSHLMPKYTET